MISIQFLGTGGAFEPHLGNSAAVVKLNGKCYLLDCGHTVYGTLVRKDKISGIDGIIMTHLHDDHCGSLSTLLYHYYFLFGIKMCIMVPDEKFQEHLYEYLRYSMDDPKKYISFDKISLSDGISAIETTGDHVTGMISYAYAFTDNNEITIYSGDLGQLDNYIVALKKWENITRIYQDVTFYPGISAHAYFKEVETILADYDVYGYHCDHNKAPSDLQMKLVANYPELLL